MSSWFLRLVSKWVCLELAWWLILPTGTLDVCCEQLWIFWCTDTSDPGHFGPKTLRTYRSMDPAHFGITEVSRHHGHFGTRQSEYLHWRPITLYIMQRTSCPWITENNFKFNSSGLYRAALSLGGELQSLILTMSSCSAPCSTAVQCKYCWAGPAEITRRAWLQTGCRVTDQLENGGRQRINVSASNTRENEWRSDVNTYDNYSIWTE